MYSLRYLIIQAIDIYSIIIVIRVILSWISINQNSSFFKIYLFLIQITEPVLGRVRHLLHNLMPNMMIDFSPFIVIILLNIIRNFFIGV